MSEVADALDPSARDDALVQAFLDRFARALVRGETQALARMWETPALVLDDQHARAVAASREVEEFFAGARAHYDSRGIIDTRADVSRIEWLTDRIVVAQVRWPYLDERGQELGEERSTYVLWRGEDGELRVRAAIVQAASEPH